MNTAPITSAQRATISMIVDTAIDVTLQGRYVADAEFHGGVHAVIVATHPVGDSQISEKGELLICYMNPGHERDGETRDERIETELAHLFCHLHGKLQEAQS
ncbi:hypothetical protein [Chromohalobacter nigrandesensis]|uniref:hypothetical protein n=1 Tax=Chromohalobacter nigrandesensis TaxID=119863 RepID=UPI001FF4085B|nr:hypothetical protein [Chromohalobacter nigrandesensis]MCK0743594.1 hypothetical protein [Chromohalobacter nigrandesensis]